MYALGRQVLIELIDCDLDALNNLDFLKTMLREVAESIGATVVNDAFYQFSPHGISGVVVVAESHLSIHTWPEHGYAAVDVFTCGDVIDPKDAVKLLVDKLNAKESSYIELKRGIVHENRVSVN